LINILTGIARLIEGVGGARTAAEASQALLENSQTGLAAIPKVSITQEDIRTALQDSGVASNATMQELITAVSTMRPLTATDLNTALDKLITTLQGPDASNVNLATIQDALGAAKVALDGLHRETLVASVQIKLDKIKSRLFRLTQSSETPGREPRPRLESGTPSGQLEKQPCLERPVSRLEQLHAQPRPYSRNLTDPFAATPHHHRPVLRLRGRHRPVVVVTRKAFGAPPALDFDKLQQDDIDA
jgi:hypothetical protein